MVFVKGQHIDWIDGAKGVAIVAVVLLHSLPCLREIGWIWHIGQAVPVFLFITAYLISMRFESLQTYFQWERIAKMLKKVFVPFVFVLLIQLVCLALIDRLPSLKTIVKTGGIGPGSYYVWLYLQAWVIIPFMVMLVRKLPIWVSMLIMLVVSIIAEYVFVPLESIEYIGELYRLLPIRYLMVLYLGCIWPLLKDKQRYILYGLAGVSAFLMLKDLYLADNVLFVNIMGGGKLVPSYWEGYHWYTAFYVVLPITLLERLQYADVWKSAGKYSWQLFLLQMMCLGFII